MNTRAFFLFNYWTCDCSALVEIHILLRRFGNGLAMDKESSVCLCVCARMVVHTCRCVYKQNKLFRCHEKPVSQRSRLYLQWLVFLQKTLIAITWQEPKEAEGFKWVLLGSEVTEIKNEKVSKESFSLSSLTIMEVPSPVPSFGG